MVRIDTGRLFGMKKWILLCAMLVSQALVAGEPVDFSLEGADGTSHKLSDYRGRWVVVNYWATWCPPCLEEIPELVDFHERNKAGNAVVLGVNFEDISDASLQEFLEGQLITYPILREQPGASTVLGSVPGLPTTFIVSPEGVPMARQVGPITAAMLEAYIRKKTRPAQASNSIIKTAHQ